ncbi:protein kinase domain protein, partial [Ichthyophthirius multifiliis]
MILSLQKLQNKSIFFTKIYIFIQKKKQCIGTGTFGKVYLIQKKDNRIIYFLKKKTIKFNNQKIKEKTYAIKILKKINFKNKKQINQIQTERNILVNIESPFIVQVKYAFQNSVKLYIVMEFCQGGDIFNHMVKHPCFPENKVKFYAVEIFLAIKTLHENQILYRDLKPENILITSSGNIKLTDFGLSKSQFKNKQLTYTYCGTPEYMSPEMLKKEGHDFSTDWWSYGAVIYEMLNGAPPFYSKNQKDMIENIKKTDVQLGKNLSVECQDFLKGLLQRDVFKLGNGPNGAQDIQNHSFFKNIDWESFLQLKVEPPFIPKICNRYDLSNIDQDFVRQKSCDTPFEQFERNSKKNNFQGFSYE